MKTRLLAMMLFAALLVGLWGCGKTVEVEQTSEPTNDEISALPTGGENNETTVPDSGSTVLEPNDKGINAIPLAEYEVTSYPIPTENIYTFSYARPFTSPSPKGGYYNCVGGTYLSYTPFGGEAVTLCTQSGCKHSDFSCPAYMGGKIENLGEYRGMIYACVTTEDETQIVCHNPATGEHEILAQRESIPVSKDLMQQEVVLWLARIAYGKLYYSEEITTTTYEYNEYGAAMTAGEESEVKYWEYDIET